MKTLLDLSGKVALVTEGSRGLGFQIAQGLGEMGAKVVITARKPNELEEAIEKLREQGIEADSVQADLVQLENVPALTDQALAAFGSLDILVNNAANNWVAPAEDFPNEAWNKIRTLTLDAPFHLAGRLRSAPSFRSVTAKSSTSHRWPASKVMLMGHRGAGTSSPTIREKTAW